MGLHLKSIVRFFIIILIISVSIPFFNVSNIAAQEGDDKGGDRVKKIENTFTQYSWQLVRRSDGKILCAVVINHEGFPNETESMAACQSAFDYYYPTDTPMPTSESGGTSTPYPTATPFNFGTFYADSYWLFISEDEVTHTSYLEIPDIIINLYPPATPVKSPYVFIRAVEPYSEFEISRIAGTVNGKPFECQSDQCIIPLLRDSEITFWAESTFGDQTEEGYAVARVWLSNNYYNVRITNLEQFNDFTDSCRYIWGDTAQGESPDWVYLPESPNALYTDHNLHYLAGKLILHRFVDGSVCPSGGIYASGAPTGCGIVIANDAMIEWQNRFNPTIWAAGKQQGVAPVLIKSLMELETQFWPENAQYTYEEFGFTQINELGADVALRWNDDLKNQLCSTLLFDCDKSFANMNDFEQAMLRGALIQSINVYCPACENMMDLDIAEQSISISAQILKSNCRQTDYVMEGLELKAATEDMWKFTFLSYHAGYSCLEESLKIVTNKGEPPDWEHVSANLTCPEAKDYVEDLWDLVTEFQPYLAPQPTLSPLQLTPTGQSNLVFVPPTATPTITPTPKNFLTDGVLHIFIYIDLNNNNVMEPEELINNANLIATFANGISTEVQIINGEAIIPFERQFINSDVELIIKESYHQTTVKIPANGELFDILRINPPIIPEFLP